MKYFGDEAEYLVVDVSKEPGAGKARNYERLGTRIFGGLVKACLAVMIICGIVMTTGILYNQHKISNSGIGGLETATAPNIFVPANIETAPANIESVTTSQVIQPSTEGAISIDILETAPIEEISAFVDVDDAASFESDDMLTYMTYRVKKGDMISLIAQEHGITQDTIISVNNIKQSRLIQIGQFLKIPSSPGILYTAKVDDESLSSIAEKYNVSLERCATVNGLEEDGLLAAGTTIFVPDASLDWATIQEINGDLFIKPLRSYRLTSYYGWRSSPFSGTRTFHSGVDMAASSGTSIYAALNGTVTATGYNATYGNYVIISHHSGYQTLYGHMKSISVKKGDYVYTTTKIGQVGSTGLSTGPHLHFTVTKNGNTVNPTALWK